MTAHLHRTGLLLLAATLCLNVAMGLDEDACRFVWEEANARMATADTPAEFREAARTYERLLRLGVRNGPLYANLGTALLEAGMPAEALACYRHAERYDGSTPELRDGMRLALQTLTRDESADLSWYRPLLAWHYSLPAQDRFLAAALAFLAFWLSLCLRRLNLSTAGTALGTAALVIFVLFASSALTSLHQSQVPLALTWDQAAEAQQPGGPHVP